MDMEQQFDAVLTGSDTEVNGIVTERNGVYEFNALDESLQLTIARDANGHWVRIAGSQPYFSGWVGELSEQIKTAQNQL